MVGGQDYGRPEFRPRQNLVVGVIGAILGGVLFQIVGLAATGLLGSLICATVGAIVLLFLLQKFGKRL